MRREIAATLVGAALMFAMSISRANAGDSVSCQTKNTPQTKMNADGTKCEASTFGLPSNKATAKASGLSLAEAAAGNGATASANAKNNSQADCLVAAGEGSATSSGLGSMARVDISPVGGGKAKATGPGSTALSEISSANPVPAGGNVQSTAEGGAAAVADVEGTDGGSAIANAKNESSADAEVKMIGGGMAKATSDGSGASADSLAEENCKAMTTAKGSGSAASAECQDPGSTVTAEATNGSSAFGSDTAPPVCSPAPGGKAIVRSPMGNCP